ncbi:macro domain-containing protein [Streptomyces zhihengii]|uniref:Macro domain-containing protein n=1 Tax=Streptomyces zhihengii TaxID=1818004 RepID=A0ABS2UTE3_9ACTN|nr:hypothetical protein [Streptomyces zhihengii]MBM9620842.1 hypothetical protein [Streptomyces zhihengii]
MSPRAGQFDVASVLREVKTVRLEGLVRIRDLELPLLRRAAVSVPGAVTDAWPVEVENLLRAAVSRLGGGELQDAAELTLGLAHGMRDRPPADRRRLAAQVYSISVERFRKSQEEMILGQIAEQVCWLAGTGARATAPNDVGLLPPRLQHRTLHVPRPGRPPAVLTLHVHPVELLRDMDVVVSPSNIHFGLPEMYKSSVAASLRRAGAVRDDAGDVVADPVHDELLAWRAHHGVLHRPVRPGTVAPTGPGALAARGIRRLHHAAVAVPRPGTNDYDATPQDVAAAAARVLVLTAQESAAYDPPLRTVCFPLLGSGRGGLPVESSVSALWSALAPAAGQGRELHLVVRRPLIADLVTEVLGARTAAGDDEKGRDCG